GILKRVHHVVPNGKIGGRRRDGQCITHKIVEALFMKHRGDLVNRISVPDGYHGVQGHIREQRDLGTLVVWYRPISPAQQCVGINTDLAQFLHGVLGGLGLELAGRSDEWHKGQVHKGGVVAAQAQAHLAGRLEKWQGLDIAYGTADFDDGDVSLAIPRGIGATRDKFLDFVRNMRNDLDGFSEVVTTTFFTQDGFVDLAGGEVVELPHAGGDEAFVMTQIKVGFSAVFGNEDFAMLEGAHGARINVDIRIELQHGDAQATRFEDGGQRSSSNALTERGHYP